MGEVPKVNLFTRIWWQLRRSVRSVYQRLSWKLMFYAQADSTVTVTTWRSYGARIGANVHINPSCHLDKGYAALLEIQDHAVVAMEVAFILHDSSVNNVVGGPLKVGRIVVEEGAYIGAFVIILPGVVIGKGSIVGAGSLVTSDVKPGTAVVGRPARSIGGVQEVAQRFLERANRPSDMATYITFPSQKEKERMSPEELKAVVLQSNRKVTDWVDRLRRPNA